MSLAPSPTVIDRRPSSRYASLPLAPHPVVAASRSEFATGLDLRHAGKRQLVLRYELLGDAALPALFVAGGISAGRHVAASHAFDTAGWWGAQVGAGRALDPRSFRIVAFDWLGADGKLDVAIDPADQADAIAALLDALGIERLAGFVGSSYGAQHVTVHGWANWSRSAAPIARTLSPVRGARCSVRRSRWAHCSAMKPTAWRWRGSWRC